MRGGEGLCQLGGRASERQQCCKVMLEAQRGSGGGAAASTCPRRLPPVPPVPHLPCWHAAGAPAWGLPTA